VLGKPADEAKSGLDDLSGLGIVPGAKQNCLEEAASTNAALAPAGWARAAGGGMGETRGHTGRGIEHGGQRGARRQEDGAGGAGMGRGRSETTTDSDRGRGRSFHDSSTRFPRLQITKTP
jgi:hypothetical protein